MQFNLKMIDRGDYEIAGGAALLGLIAKYSLAALFAFGELGHITIQGLVTVLFGLGAVVAQHFMRRYLRRRWPDKENDS